MTRTAKVFRLGTPDTNLTCARYLFKKSIATTKKSKRISLMSSSVNHHFPSSLPTVEGSTVYGSILKDIVENTFTRT